MCLSIANGFEPVFDRFHVLEDYHGAALTKGDDRGIFVSWVRLHSLLTEISSGTCAVLRAVHDRLCLRIIYSCG
jgi:hypothetical protein